MNTYRKLPDGSWGVQCDEAHKPGTQVTVTLKDGRTKTETLGERVGEFKGMSMYAVVRAARDLNGVEFQIVYIEKWGTAFAAERRGQRTVFHDRGSDEWKQAVIDAAAKQPKDRSTDEEYALRLEAKLGKKPKAVA